MVDTKDAQVVAREALYATLGAGQLLIEKTKGATSWMRSYWTPSGFRAFWSTRQKRALESYAGLADRGRKTARSISRSAPAKRAEAQTKTARTQVKAAATSARKAPSANVEATKSAARKVS
jgi:hypothetical protein